MGAGGEEAAADTCGAAASSAGPARSGVVAGVYQGLCFVACDRIRQG